MGMSRKTCLLVCCFLLLFVFKSIGQAPNSSCKVEIYLLKHSGKPSSENASDYFLPSKKDISDTPLIHNNEILEYEITGHPTAHALSTELSDTVYSYRFVTGIDVLKRLQESNVNVSLQGLPFPVVVNGQPVYGAYFWTSLSSFSCSWMTSYITQKGFSIESARFSASKPDPRQNIWLINCLKRTNRLRLK